jgi:hypothetical protein
VAGLLQKEQQQPRLDKTAHPATRSATAPDSFMPAVMSATHDSPLLCITHLYDLLIYNTKGTACQLCVAISEDRTEKDE